MVKATAIGYFQHSSRVPELDDRVRSYNLLEKLILDLGLQPTHFSVSDGKSRSKWITYGGSLQRIVVESKFEAYVGLGLAVAYNSTNRGTEEYLATVHFTFDTTAEQTSVTFIARNDYLVLESDDCERIIGALSTLWHWDYGYGFERDMEKAPGIYLLGGVSRTETLEERRRLELWYNDFEPEERRKRIRDVFPYNMLGPRHLAYRLTDGRTLRDFILFDEDSELHPLADEMCLWTVRPNRTENVRHKLLGSGIIVSE